MTALCASRAIQTCLAHFLGQGATEPVTYLVFIWDPKAPPDRVTVLSIG